MITSLPTITISSPIRLISFTDLSRESRCPLQSLPRSCVSIEGAPSTHAPSRPLIVGRFFHEMLKDSACYMEDPINVGVRSIRRLYKDKVTKYKREYEGADTQPSLGIEYWSEMTDVLASVIDDFRVCRRQRIHPKREEYIAYTDAAMHGIIDEIVVTTDGIAVREFKATKSLEALVSDRHIDQLHFYAALIEAEYGEPPTSMHLQGLLGISQTIHVDEVRKRTLQERAKAFISRINRKIDESPTLSAICSPDETVCSSCAYSAFCPGLIHGTHDFDLPEERKTVVIRVREGLANVVAGTALQAQGLGIDCTNAAFSSSDFNSDEKYVLANIKIENETITANSNSQVWRMG